MSPKPLSVTRRYLVGVFRTPPLIVIVAPQLLISNLLLYQEAARGHRQCFQCERSAKNLRKWQYHKSNDKDSSAQQDSSQTKQDTSTQKRVCSINTGLLIPCQRDILLYFQIKQSFKIDPAMDDFKRNSVLYALLQVKYRDEEILERACEVVKFNASTNVQSLTNLLYILAKFKYVPKCQVMGKDKSSSFLEQCALVLLAQPKLPVDLACRNLWNLYALDYYNPALFDSFSQTIVQNHDKLNQIDVANSLRAFAHFKHTSSDVAVQCLESLVRTTIRRVSDWKLQTIAVVTNALAELDVANKTVFTIVKNVVMQMLMEDDPLKEQVDRRVPQSQLTPMDCAQISTAYARLGLFDDNLDLFELLEKNFIKHIDDATGETLVTMFTSHASWAQHMIEQCLVHKKQPRRVYNYFKKYNEEFYMHLATHLIKNISDINLKGVFLVLAHGNMAHLKKRSNVRLMRQFSIKGIETLKSEQASINLNPDYQLNFSSTFDMVCAKYFEYSSKYCLNVQDKDELVAKFKELLEIDIEALVERISPLGFKFIFANSIPQRNELVEEAMANDNDEGDLEGEK